MNNLLSEGVDLHSLSGRALAGDAHFFEDSTGPAKIKEYLDSPKDVDKVRGMKQLLAMISKGRDIPEFFPDVVKNVVVKNIEVKKMVYTYLVHYADFDRNCREIALLSINSFQKDLSENNQLVRGLALRVMTSIRVPEIIQIQLLAIRKCASDSSPYVRKCASHGLPKIYAFDPDSLDQLKTILEQLLNDSSTMVLGSAMIAFNEICPTSYEILHKHYRKICQLLADFEEWTQVTTLEILTRYIRNQFCDPSPHSSTINRYLTTHRSNAAVKGKITRKVVKKAFYSDEEDEVKEEEVDDHKEASFDINSLKANANTDELEGFVDPDHELLLKCSLSLLRSRNAAVVLAVVALHYYCGYYNKNTSEQLAKALLRIMHNRREIQYIVLQSINCIAREQPEVFRAYITDFFVKGVDPLFNRALKLEIITSIAQKEHVTALLKEFQVYLKDSNVDFVRLTIRAIGRVVDVDPTASEQCLEGLMHLLLCYTEVNHTHISTTSALLNLRQSPIVADCVMVLRQLLQQSQGASQVASRVLRHLVKLLISYNLLFESLARENSTRENISHVLQHPLARAAVIWLVGEYHDSLAKISADVLRLVSRQFIHESSQVKLQAMNLAVKLGSQDSAESSESEQLQSLVTYVLELSRYDSDTDIRDRARFMTAMMGLATTNESHEDDAQYNHQQQQQPALTHEEALTELSAYASKVMLAKKLPPITLLAPLHDGLPQTALNSLSNSIGHTVHGYQPIPSYQVTQPDTSVRNNSNNPLNTNRFVTSIENNPAQGDSATPMQGDDLRGFYNDQRSDSSESDAESRKQRNRPARRNPSDSSDSEQSSRSESSASEESSEDESDHDNDSRSSDTSVASTRSSRSSSSDESGKRRQSSVRRSAPTHQVVEIPALASQSPSSQSKSNAVANNNTAKQIVTKPPMKKVQRKVNHTGGSSSGVGQQSVSLQAGSAFLDDLLLSTPQQPTTLSNQTKAKPQTADLPWDDLLGLSTTSNLPAQTTQAINTTSTTNKTTQSTARNENILDLQDFLSAPLPVTNNSNNNNSNKSNSNIMKSRDELGYLDSLQAVIQSNTSGAYTSLDDHLNTTNTNHSNDINPLLALSSISLQSNNNQKQQQQQLQVDDEVLLAPKLILRGDLAAGLQVHASLRVRPSSIASSNNVSGIALSYYINFKNIKDHVLRRVRINLPTDLRKTALPEIPQLNPQEEVRLPLEITLPADKCFPQQCKCDIRSDRGAFTGMLSISETDCLLPATQMTSESFETLRSQLKGFCEQSKRYSLQALVLPVDSYQAEQMLLSRVISKLPVHIVQGPGVGELYFAGVLKKGLREERALITLQMFSTSNEVMVKVNCDDAVFASSFHEEVKRAVSMSNLL